MEKSLSLVIPCLNEEQAAPLVLQTLQEIRSYFLDHLNFQDFQVIVVDDASQDRSVEIVNTFPFVELYRHSETKGYGASLRAGFEKSRGRWIGFLDMDNSYPAHHLLPMWKLLVAENLDMVVGQRAFKSDGMSFTRGFGNWMFSFLSRLFLKTSLKDVCSGFRLFTRDRLPEVLAISESTLGYSLEMSIRLSSSGWRAKEHAIEYHPRKGDSKLSVWKDGWGFLFLILSATKKSYFKREVRS